MTARQTPAHQEIIAEMVQRIVEKFDPQKVILCLDRFWWLEVKK
jgi:hypothetical protein